MEATQSNSLGKLMEALAKAQLEMRGALKDAKNPHLRNNYADLASVWAAWQEAGPKHGLAIVQMAEAGEGFVAVRTMLGHSSGEWVQGSLRVPFQEQKGINIAQALGSALTYARRYALAAAVGIAPEDDDGHGAAPAGGNRTATNGHAAPSKPDPPAEPQEPTITDKDKQNLAALSGKTADWKLAQKTLLRHFKVDALGAIPAKCFPEAVKMLRDMATTPTPTNEDADVPDEEMADAPM